MKDIVDKADSTAGATGTLPADEYNDHKNELQGSVESSSQTLSAGITNQLSQALFINGAGAQTVIDAGSIDSILLSPITGANGLVVPGDFAFLSGCVLLFEKVTANTSTSVTVNFGQTGTELGAKNLKKADGSALVIGEVIGLCTIIYNLASDEWRLINSPFIKASASWPVGITYIQFPGDSDPATAGLPGTWSNVSSELAGDFIRFEGGNASAFESGQQLDAMQRITGQFDTRRASNDTDLFSNQAGVFVDGGAGAIEKSVTHSTLSELKEILEFDNNTSTSPNPSKTDDSETRAINRTVRKWRRTA